LFVFDRYSNELKEYAIDYARRFGVRAASRDLAPEIPKSTIENWLYKSVPIERGVKREEGGGRKTKLPEDVEDLAVQAILDSRAKLNEDTTVEAMKIISDVAKEHGIDFAPSRSYLHRFMHRHRLSLHKATLRRKGGKGPARCGLRMIVPRLYT
jgi:hypothetical protein